MLSVVIPVYNKVNLTMRSLQSILEHSSVPLEVFVIDNASVDETPMVLLSFKSEFEKKSIPFTIITNQKNVGFGRACNQGVRLSKGNYIAILNNDTWLMPEWDRALIESIKQYQVDLIGPFFDERPFSNNPVEVSKEYLAKNKNRFRKHFVPILMLFKKESIQKLQFPDGGLFDERFFVTYEDTDLLKRMKDLKMRWGQTSDCYIWHHSMGTRGEPGLLPEGYEAEGLRLFIEKWHYDPRSEEHTFWERLKRRYRKSRAKRGLF